MPVVSGPRVVDLKGDTGFDPFDAYCGGQPGQRAARHMAHGPGRHHAQRRVVLVPALGRALLSVVPLPTVTVPPVPTPVPLEAITEAITASVAALLPVPAPVTNARRRGRHGGCRRRRQASAPLRGAGAGGALALRRVGRGLCGGTKRRERGMSRSPAFPVPDF
ncbi:MAG: hypothetical protein R3A10_16690 [Caldilineaceae bacterium]